MRVELSTSIEDDLEVIASHIALHNPERAISFVRELRAKIRGVGENPFLYRVRPEIQAKARLATFGKYVILFYVRGEVTFIDRVVHGERNLPDFLEQN